MGSSDSLASLTADALNSAVYVLPFSRFILGSRPLQIILNCVSGLV